MAELSTEEVFGPVGQGFDTKLSIVEEPQFQLWKRKHAPNDSGDDYDLRGAFKAGLKPAGPEAGKDEGHWPDTFKKPNHPTFSNESIYAKFAPEKAGSWKGETYVPAKGGVKELSTADVFGGGDALDTAARAEQSPMSLLKDIGARFGKGTAAAVDMVLGIPGQALGVGADIGARAYAAGAGESRKMQGLAGEVAKEAIPAWIEEKIGMTPGGLKAPIQTIIKKLGGGEAYDQTIVTKAIEDFGHAVEKHTGGKLTKEDTSSLIDTLMLAAGAKGTDMGIEAAMAKKPARGTQNRDTYTEPTEVADVATEAKSAGPEAVEIVSSKQVKEMFSKAKKAGYVGGEDVSTVKEFFEKAKRGPPQVVPKEDLNGAPVDENLVSAVEKLRTSQEPMTKAEVEAISKAAENTDKLISGPAGSQRGAVELHHLAAVFAATSVGTALGLWAYKKYKEMENDEAWKQQNEKSIDRSEDYPSSPGTAKERTLQAAIGGAALAGAIRQKGVGSWHPEAYTRLSRSMWDGKLGPINGEPTTAANIEAHPFKIASDRMVKTWLNKYAGTLEDPLKDVEIPFINRVDDNAGGLVQHGRDTIRWEDATDKGIVNVRGTLTPDELTQMRTKENEPVWDVRTTQRQAGKAIADYLSHVGDYLRQHYTPEKLQQVDLVRAVKETAKWDKELAAKMEKAAADETKDMPVYKEYPDGMKWVEVGVAPKELPKNWTVTPVEHAGKTYWQVRENGKVIPQDDSINYAGSFETEAAANYAARRLVADKQLKNEGDQMGHCVGGYCDYVESGDSKIYSLRDAKGKSHVTIEVNPKPDAHGRLMSDDGKADIVQIKGKQNRAPIAEYLPKVQDFVKGGKWGKVGDLANADLHPFKTASGSVDPYVYRPGTVDQTLIGLKPGYYTKAELHKAYTKAGGEIDPRYLRKEDVAGLEAAGTKVTDAMKHEAYRYTGDASGFDLSYNKWQGPRGERGSATTDFALGLAAIGGGAAVGATLTDNPLKGAIYGAILGTLAGTRGGRTVLSSPEKTLGLISTRLGNIAPELLQKARNFELKVFKTIDYAMEQSHPFLAAIGKLPKDLQEKVNVALLNGDAATIRQIPGLAEPYAKLQGLLSDFETAHQSLRRFKEGVTNYFPRLVKDLDGLKATLGTQAAAGLEGVLLKAEAAMIKAEDRGLTDVERSLVVNNYLRSADQTSFQPGYAKGRKVDEITPDLAKFYEPPAESLLRYLTGATLDLSTARFFGRDLATKKQGGKLYNDLDSSIGNVVARLVKEDKLTREQAVELRDVLKSRFVGGEKFMTGGLQDIRNLSNAGLLGNFWSAATQIGDSLMTVYHHGRVPTLESLVKTVRGKADVTVKQLGLVNHAAEELASQRVTGQVLQAALKYSGFMAIDRFAKGLGLNAALAKNQRLVSSEAGLAKFAAKYERAFGKDFPALVEDLRNKKVSDKVEQLLFSELSDTQPISKLEMPQAYLDHPNGRILYQLKTYMLKQADIVRRDVYNNFKEGRIKEGTKNALALATVYAAANVPGDIVKDLLSGREVKAFEVPKLIENIFQTFGLNRYATDRLAQGKISDVAMGMVTPPAIRMAQDVANVDPRAVSYVPLVGRGIYDRELGGNERREIAETVAENKGKPKEQRKVLSPAAKAFRAEQRRLRQERDAARSAR